MARVINIPETKGSFQLMGTVLGTNKDTFFKQIQTKKDKKNMNFCKFGAKTSPDNTIYVDVSGMEKNEVYFGKKSEEKGGKYQTKKVAWNDRKTFKEDGFKLIGTNVGLEQKINDQGKTENIKKTLVEFDACEYISQHLKDDMELFMKGKLDFSSFANDKGEISRAIKFIPNQISRLSTPIDFEKEDFKEKADFEQTIIFTGIAKDENKEDNKFLVSAKIVTYSTIEDAEFIILNPSLAATFRKNLKPYTAIKVYGNIVNKVVKEEVTEADTWGEENPMSQVNRSYIRELVITGADASSIDKETYTEEALDEAVRAVNEFGGTEESKKDNTNWGEQGGDKNSSGDGWDEEWD